ncbi:hypothetical protein SAMN05216371_6665 [Streptomyces sp. TLI_053]|uniref:hypothetical protein n=1 Tax=Streptomyces sp. TLI_053 TaxID=1855352 RepID=UPI00087986F6|nr:hypothetical protein [Streptomyces sp. TLI_053]SDT81480.1 hypothetical protein SAMN05216371_6665 [Streptomyces sp. TLI_053]
MSLSRTGARSGDPAPPAEPRRRFGLRRGAPRALPAGDPPAASGPVETLPVPASARTAEPGPSVLREVGPHFVIASATAHPNELRAAIGALRPVPDAVVVIAAAPDSAKVLRDRMTDLGVITRARGATHLVLAASGLAALAPNGRRPAEVVAERSGVPVVAPDGLVEITPAGHLTVNDPEGALARSSWWRCEPGAQPRRVAGTIGAVAPVESRRTRPTAFVEPPAVPAPAAARGRANAVRVLRLPAGFWLTDPADPATTPLPDLRLAAAAPGTAVIVIGTPTRPVLLPEDFAEAVLALPLGSDRPLISAPWAAPDELSALIGALTARTARPVQAAIGLPVLGHGGPTSRVLDREGRIGWEPFLLRLSSAPGCPTTPAAWRNGGADWRTAGPGVFQAFPYWALEAVPAGLWLRPEPPHVLTPRFRRPEPSRPLLIVGERDRPVPADAFEELGALLGRLPAVGAEGFGLLVHGLLEPAAETVGRFVARTYELEWLGAEQPAGGPPAVAPVSYGTGGAGSTRRAAAPDPAAVPAGAAAAAVPGTAGGAPAALGPGTAHRVPPVPAPASRSEVPAGVRTGSDTGTRTEPRAELPTAHRVPPVPAPEPESGTAAEVEAGAGAWAGAEGRDGTRFGAAVPAPEPEAGPEPGAEPLPDPEPVPVPPPAPVRATAGPATGSAVGATAPPRRVPLATGGPTVPPTAGTVTTAAGSGPDLDGRRGPAGAPVAPAGGAPLPFRTPEVPPGDPAAEPPAAEPPASGLPGAAPSARPSTTEPSSTEPPSTEQSSTEPPDTEPSAGDPLSAEPPGVPVPPQEPSHPSPQPQPARYFGLDDSPVPVTASTAAERDAVRALLGDHYHRCTGRLDQLATRLPGLRSTSQDDFKPDLAAVLLHHTDSGVPVPRAALIAAARSGAPELRPFLHCLGAGLRRLPSHHGAVLLGAGAGLDPESVLAHYPTGRLFREPAPLAGLTAPGAELPGSSVEFLVWSATGRRTSVFDPTDGPAQAAFPPGTAFTVVGQVPADGDRPACVLLRESGGDPSERNRNSLTRLRAWLERRAAMPPAERPRADAPERFHLTPGVHLDTPEPPDTSPDGPDTPEDPDTTAAPDTATAA